MLARRSTSGFVVSLRVALGRDAMVGVSSGAAASALDPNAQSAAMVGKIKPNLRTPDKVCATLVHPAVPTVFSIYHPAPETTPEISPAQGAGQYAFAITTRRSTGSPVTMHLPGPSYWSTKGMQRTVA